MAKLTAKERARFKSMVEKTKRNAHASGTRWTDDDVAYIMKAIEQDDTTFNMAMGIGRSYYAVQSARGHVRFAMDHQAVLYK